jgi:TRAP-type C4-dicarboxylate transport system substrate-binding protein
MSTRRTAPRVGVLLLLALLAAGQLAALEIKLGSVAPEGSPWDKALKRIALEWQKISAGQVTLKIYGGGVAGDESDMIRKMRINQIQAAAMTGSGLGKISSEWLVYQLPFLATTDAELDYLFQKLRPRLEPLLEEKGFTFVAFTKSGWLHFFSKTKITYPRDMQNLKFFVMEGSPDVDQAWKAMGFHVVPLPPNDAFAALQSGMVEVFSASPLTAAAFQWFALAPNMTDFNWTPLTAGMVVSNQAWRRVPAELRPKLQQAAQAALDEMTAEFIAVDAQALQIMKDNGLVVHHVPPEAYKAWEDLVDRALLVLVGDVISPEIYEQARTILAEYRSR